MVHDLIPLLQEFNYLFLSGKASPRKKKKRLKKDVRSEKKEKKLEKKAKNKFLGEEIEHQKWNKENQKTDAAIINISAWLKEIINNIQNYEVVAAQYQSTKNPKYTEKLNAYSQQLINDLKGLFGWVDQTKDFINEDLDYVKTWLKDINKEDKILHKTFKITDKQSKNLRKSAKEGEKLDEEQKEAVIKKRVEQLKQELALNQEMVKLLNTIHDEVLEPDVKELEELQNQRKDIRKKWKKESTNWDNLQKLLRDLYDLMSGKKQFVARMSLRNRKVTVANQQINKILADKQLLYQEMSKEDKYYESLDVKEEIEVSHEKHMGDLVNSL